MNPATDTYRCAVCGGVISEPYDAKGRLRLCCSPHCRGSKRLEREKRELIPKLRNAGMKVSTIAKVLGATPQAIRWHLESPDYRHHIIANINDRIATRRELNFQEKLRQEAKILSEHNRGFLEGIIEGEGCLSFSASRTKDGYKAWWVQLDIPNTRRRLLERIQAIIGTGFIIEHKPTNKNWHIRFDLRFNHTTLRWLLPQLILVTKEIQRQLVLEALRLLRGHGGKHNREEISERLEEIAKEIRTLNQSHG